MNTRLSDIDNKRCINCDNCIMPKPDESIPTGICYVGDGGLKFKPFWEVQDCDTFRIAPTHKIQTRYRDFPKQIYHHQ